MILGKPCLCSHGRRWWPIFQNVVLESFPLWFRYESFSEVMKEKRSYPVIFSHATGQCTSETETMNLLKGYCIFQLIYIFFNIWILWEQKSMSTLPNFFFQFFFGSTPEEEHRVNKRQFHGLDPEKDSSGAVSSSCSSSALAWLPACRESSILLGACGDLLTWPQPCSGPVTHQPLWPGASSSWRLLILPEIPTASPLFIFLTFAHPSVSSQYHFLQKLFLDPHPEWVPSVVHTSSSSVFLSPY